MTFTIAVAENNFFIFTGGPGAGKTTVLAALKDRGYLTEDEVARDIIQHQVIMGGNAIHTGDKAAFCQLMLAASITSYKKNLSIIETVFFDRGIPGLVGYSKVASGFVTDDVKEAVQLYRYNQHVFIFPPWEQIYQNDTERMQDFTEARDTYESVKQAHLDCGYTLIEVPKVSVNERVNFIVAEIERLSV